MKNRRARRRPLEPSVNARHPAWAICVELRGSKGQTLAGVKLHVNADGEQAAQQKALVIARERFPRWTGAHEVIMSEPMEAK